MVHHLHECLDDETARQWELTRDGKMPTAKDRKNRDQSHERPNRSGPPASSGAVRKKLPCEACSGGHGLFECDDYLSLSLSSRRKFVNDRGLCTNCLLRGHKTSECRDIVCRLPACRNDNRHNSTLCPTKEIRKLEHAASMMDVEGAAGTSRTSANRRAKSRTVLNKDKNA